MINLCVELGKTGNGDIVINSENDFPLMFIGRGSYTGNVKIHTYHYFSVQEESHLIYIGRYTSIGDNVQIYCDINHDHRSLYMGVIPEFGDQREDAPIRDRLGQMTARMPHKGMIVIGNDATAAESLSPLFSKLSGRMNIYTAAIRPDDDESAICSSDSLVLGRDLKNIQRISYA